MWTSAISHCSSAPGARGTLSWTSPARGLLILESRSRLGLLSHLEAGLGLGRCLAPTAVGVRPQCPDTWTFPGGLGDLPAQQLASPGVTDQETPRWKQCLEVILSLLPHSPGHREQPRCRDCVRGDCTQHRSQEEDHGKWVPQSLRKPGAPGDPGRRKPALPGGFLFQTGL